MFNVQRKIRYMTGVRNKKQTFLLKVDVHKII